MQRDLQKSFRSLLVLSSVIFSSVLWADTIEKVKGQQVLLSFDDPTAEIHPGDRFFGTEDGKKKALIEIVKAKSGKAIGKILKGNAKEGMDLMAASSKKKDDSQHADSAEPSKKPHRVRNAGVATLFQDLTIGALLGYSMDSQSVAITGVGTTSMAGGGFSLKGFADIPISGDLSLLSRGGVEQFYVKASTSSSQTSIMYANLDLLLKYGFGGQTVRPFMLGGIGLHFPISKSSDVLNVDKIASTTVFFAGGGLNWVLGGNSYMQFSAEYGMFPPSNDVTTYMIAVRGGMGFRF